MHVFFIYIFLTFKNLYFIILKIQVMHLTHICHGSIIIFITTLFIFYNLYVILENFKSENLIKLIFLKYCLNLELENFDLGSEPHLDEIKSSLRRHRQAENGGAIELEI